MYFGIFHPELSGVHDPIWRLAHMFQKGLVDNTDYRKESPISSQVVLDFFEVKSASNYHLGRLICFTFCPSIYLSKSKKKNTTWWMQLCYNIRWVKWFPGKSSKFHSFRFFCSKETEMNATFMLLAVEMSLLSTKSWQKSFKKNKGVKKERLNSGSTAPNQ